MTSIVPLLCLGLMVYSVIRSQHKLRTLLSGLLTVGGTLGIVFALVKMWSLDETIMGHVAFALIFIIPAYVMWTHARSTEKLTAVSPDSPSQP